MKTIPLAAQSERKATSKAARWPLVLVIAAVAGGLFGLTRLPRNNPPATPTATQTQPQAEPQTQAGPVTATRLNWRVMGSYAHDPRAFTQGLVWYDGGFYEGTGLEGKSSLRRVEFPSGRVVKNQPLSRNVFGEGVALAGDKLYQLTWQSHIGYVYDRDTFKLIREFNYPNEGWGLTYNGQYLIQSDGTDVLTYLDLQSMQAIGHCKVTMNGAPLQNLNELEWIDGEIWANVWQKDIIVRIDPASGQVKSYLDLTGLLPPSARTGNEDVLNGIAYDEKGKRLFITGKQWPRLFEIKVLGAAA